MSEFRIIEKEYLKIDPLSEDLIQFYEKHLDYFKNQNPIDDEELGKYICMLAEIGQTYSLTEKHEQAYPILDRAIKLFKKYSKKLSLDLPNNQSYNTTIGCIAHSLFNLRKYFFAKLYFNRLKGNKNFNKEYECETFIKVCNQKIINRTSIAIGIIGFIILGIKYSFKLFFTEHYNETIEYTGSLGAILLIISGLIYRRNIKL